MPYACHTCQDSFKTLSRYNSHISGPDKCKAPVKRKSEPIQRQPIKIIKIESSDSTTGSKKEFVNIERISKQVAPEKVDGEVRNSSSRARRCGMCTQCMRGDCGVCNHCKDKPKFGGSGNKSKQACVERRCPNLSNNSPQVSSNMKIDSDVRIINIPSGNKQKVSQQPRILCSYCNNPFINRADFDQHMKENHLNSNGSYQKDFKCNECSSVFVAKIQLEEHMMTAHDMTDCAECADDFNWPDPNHKCYFTNNLLRLVAGDIIPSF